MSNIIESMLNQAWSPGYLSIFLSRPFTLWPVSGPKNYTWHEKNSLFVGTTCWTIIVSGTSSCFLIVGGRGDSAPNTVEIVNSGFRDSYQLPKLATNRIAHTMCNNILCGGRETPDSCLMFDGKSKFTPLALKMVEKRANHVCWSLPSGDVLLLGGLYSPQTTERISADGSSTSADFPLPHRTE